MTLYIKNSKFKGYFYSGYEMRFLNSMNREVIHKMKETEIRRGDIFSYDFGTRIGSIQSGVRPVLVIQADNFNANAPTVIVASITSVIKKRYLPSHIILGEDFGLTKPSMVLLEQIQTVNKNDLTEYIGFVDDERLWRQINAALKKTFGLWLYNTDRIGDIRCLCPKCLNDYFRNPNYVARRLDPFQKSKGTCDKCNDRGWDYIICATRKNRLKRTRAMALKPKPDIRRSTRSMSFGRS